jgi:hypothetical protein
VTEIKNKKVETRDHYKNGAVPKSQTSRTIFKSNKMKKIKCIIIILTLFTTITACKKETTSSSGTGGGGGTVGTTGKVTITASWSNPAPWNACGSPYTVVIGLGYNSTDVANESYFASNSFYSSSATFSKDGLTAGVYYYGAKKTFNASTCGTGQGIPPTVKKSGSFTIIAGQTTTVSGVSLN